MGLTRATLSNQFRELLDSARGMIDFTYNGVISGIIRRGKVIDSVLVKETNPDELAAKMVGREVNFHVDKIAANPKQTILSVENVTAMGNRGVNALNNLSLEIRLD